MFRSDSPDYDELKIKYEILRSEYLEKKAEQKKVCILTINIIIFPIIYHFRDI
jgi:hypothetical protein